MLTANTFTPEKTDKSGAWRLELFGAITEGSEFKLPETDRSPMETLDVDCKKINRINSMGISKWIYFFKAIRNQKTHVRFFNVPVAVVNLCNFVVGMIKVDEVQSLFMPFYCENCSTETEVFTLVKDIKASAFKVEPIECPHCSGKDASGKHMAEFDGLPNHFFEFLHE